MALVELLSLCIPAACRDAVFTDLITQISGSPGRVVCVAAGCASAMSEKNTLGFLEHVPFAF